jgi:hypothetical protein
MTPTTASKEHEYRLLARIAALERLVAEAVPWAKWFADNGMAVRAVSEGAKSWLARAAEVVSGKAGPSEYGQPKKEGVTDA